ncbi:DUF3077 domain-containing protein [Pseudomonas fakonensis]|uniref:DUF3077 domain-containing protein n=1 Tax=Pseudomonas fakonensis TaxID=2842355 RepID=A0ABX8MZV4_9PSED|nr:DUF3077 domain-containing protein [Pseudomonas fakonensis]QXH49659.1 DUF3077 domain-containing protein [Pseudomonas fakonensis]
MGNDDQSKGEGGQGIVSLVQYAGKRGPRDWVQAIPGQPIKEVLEETSIMLGCISTLTRQALQKPSEAKTLMRATYYLSGMAKAMIQGQLPAVQGKDER